MIRGLVSSYHPQQSLKHFPYHTQKLGTQPCHVLTLKQINVTKIISNIDLFRLQPQALLSLLQHKFSMIFFFLNPK